MESNLMGIINGALETNQFDRTPEQSAIAKLYKAWTKELGKNVLAKAMLDMEESSLVELSAPLRDNHFIYGLRYEPMGQFTIVDIERFSTVLNDWKESLINGPTAEEEARLEQVIQHLKLSESMEGVYETATPMLVVMDYLEAQPDFCTTPEYQKSCDEWMDDFYG